MFDSSGAMLEKLVVTVESLGVALILFSINLSILRCFLLDLIMYSLSLKLFRPPIMLETESQSSPFTTRNMDRIICAIFSSSRQQYVDTMYYLITYGLRVEIFWTPARPFSCYTLYRLIKYIDSKAKCRHLKK